MTKPIIAIAIDMFSPGAYRAPAWPAELGPAPGFLEDYTHEKDYVYVVLQPLLFRAVADAAKAFAVSAAADPAEYFKPDRKLDPQDVVFADAALAQSLPAGVQPVPASLPPGTRISLELMRGNTTSWTSSERQIGPAGGQSASPFLVDLDEWPAIASLNFAHPLANQFAELDISQREQVYVWLAAAVMDLLRHKEDRAPLSPGQTEALTIFGLQKPPGTPAEMRVHLVDMARGQRMYDRLLQDDPAQQKSLQMSAPRFKVVDAAAFAKRIRAEIGPGLPAGATHASYLHVWWHTMCKEAARPGTADAWADGARSSEFAAALGRYFGFGERLRWPLPAFDVAGSANQVFMVPRPQSTGGRFETNAASLCELVFRVPVAGLAGDPKTLTAKLSVAGQLRDDAKLADAAHRLAPQLAQIVTRANQWHASATCRALVRRDDRDEAGQPLNDAKGIVMVQPRAAKCVPLGNPKAVDMFSIASVLLDQADSSPRHHLGEGGEGLVAVREPRRALLPEECLAFEPALMGATRWRIKGDLRAAAVATVPAQPPLPRVYEFVAARLSWSPVLGVAPGLADSEGARFKELLPELLGAGGRFKASLWLPNGAGIVDMKDRLIDADGPDSDLRFYVLDEDPATGIGKVLPASADAAPNAFSADLVIEVIAGHAGSAGAQRWLPFNTVQKMGADVPWVALERSALSRVSRSVDRWMERFHMTPVVEGAVLSPDDPLRQHLSNFNKLRIFSAGEDGAYAPVTYPDAAVPLAPAAAGKYSEALPWEHGWPQQPPFSYFIGHLYSQESATERPDVGNPDVSQDREPEALRYVRYRRAQAAERLAGYAEHQYSYRIAIVQEDFAADARIATDLRNAAGLVARGKGVAAVVATGIGEQEGRKAPLLEVTIVDGVNELEIAGRAEYFLKAFEAESEAESVQGAGRTPHVETLRNIYEAVCDFFHALDGGGASLHAQLFRFDNSLPRRGASQADPQSLPARLDLTVTGVLPLTATSGVGAKLRAGFARLATATFEDFRKEVKTLRSGAEVDVFPPVRLAIGNPGWDWRHRGVATPVPDVRLEANVVRLALDLHRPPELVVDPSAAQGRFIPFSATADPAIPGWIQASVQDVITHARDELTSLLQRPAAPGEGSSLYARREWLHMQPPKGNVVVEPASPAPADGAPQAEPKVESREGRWRLIFGDYAPTVLVPPGTMRRVARVAELFYVPVAFRPLAAHPTLITGNDTLAFAEFLLRTAGEILAGRRPADILLRPSAEGKAGDDGARAKLRLQQLLERPAGIADTLEQLAHAVHNDSDLRTVPDKVTQRALSVWDRSASTRAASLRALLGGRPELFASARAIGLALFDPDRFARALQSVQICKRISQNAQTADEAVTDVDRLVIPPTSQGEVAILVDPLEAARYDTEFELPMNRYKLADGSPSTGAIYESPIELGAVTLAVRGGTSGRTGEDFLESEHHFPPATDDKASPRGVEVDAPHWNPHWSYTLKGGKQAGALRRLYLLPSRRFPATPVSLQVAASKGNVPVNASAINLRSTAAGQAEQVFQDTLNASLHDLDGLHLVIRNDSGQAAPEAPAWSISGASATVKHHEADGWYRIDTFLEHHYFMVEADEAGDEQFANDVFEIDVQVNREGTAPAAAPPAATATPPVASSPLLLAFRRWQQVNGQASGVEAVPAQPAHDEAMSLPSLAESIAFWLCTSVADLAQVPAQEQVARGREGLLRPMTAPAVDGTSVNFRGVYECAEPDRTVKVDVLQPAPNPASERIGSVVRVSLYKPVPGAAAPVIVRGERAILRVSVLADPWSRVRLRMRQVRNRRDVDGGAPDIDPVFEMPSPYSSWSAYAHAEKVVDTQHFQEAQVPASERRLEINTVGLQDWIDKRFSSAPPDIGEVVKNRLAGVIPAGGPFAGKPYWNASEMLDPQRKVSMVLRQRIPDRHMLHNGAAWRPRWEGDLSVPRHVFGVIAAPSIDKELQAVAPATVSAGEPELEITWLDKSSGGPVYRVAWPIRFGH